MSTKRSVRRRSYDYIDAVAEVLRQRRKRLGLTLREVAEPAGCSGSNFWEWETGQRQIMVSTLDKLARALGTTAWEVLREAEDVAMERERGLARERALVAV